MLRRPQSAPVRGRIIELSHTGPIAHSSRERPTRKPKKKTRSQIVREYLKNFCSNSTIHGLRYLTEPKRHWTERVWWAIVVIASLSICGFVMHRTWTNWNEHPVIVSLDDKVTSIDKIPFPAVTICPTKKFNKHYVNFSKIKATLSAASKGNRSAFAELSAKELGQMNAILQTCSTPFSFPADLVIPSDPSIYNTMEDIMPRSRSFNYYTVWNYQVNKFNLMRTFTDDGLCYTFNSLNSHQIYADGIAPELLTVRDNPNSTTWNREDGYQVSNIGEGNSFPYHLSSQHFGLVAAFRTPYDDSDKFCSPFAAGLHVSLHAPDELPQSQKNFVHVPPEQLVTVFISPSMATTSNGLRSYDPQKRDCYFQSEHQLRFFRSYSEQKCQLECLTNFTLNQCGCVHFAMPRDNSTKVCTVLERECYVAAKQRFARQPILKQCNCLPDCTSIVYNAEISQSPFSNYLDSKKKTENQKFLFNRSGFPMYSMLSISFKKTHFIAVNRSESSTMSEFISSCGGVLGSFMGVSVLGIVELIYYFTLRLYFTWKQQNKVHPVAQIQTTPARNSYGIFKDYLTNSTVHGLRYLTEPNRHRAERIWWMVTVAAAIVICGVVMRNIWENWNEHPVIVSFDDKHTSIGRIPFPAVTICPDQQFIMQKVDADKLFAKASQLIASGHTSLDSMSPEEISQLDAIVQTDGGLLQFPSNFSIPSTTMIYNALRNVTLEQNSTIQSVAWLDQPKQLKFQPIFTNDGLCYTFNSLNSHQIYSDVVQPELLTVRENPNVTHWNREDGYLSNINESDVYPYRVFGSDVFNALIIRLGTVIDYHNENEFQKSTPGFYIIFHTPDEIPQFKSSFVLIPTEHDAYISIRPETVSTSNGLRNYSPHSRGCYFESERQLHFFKSYSQSKCELECFTNFIKKECGCAHFSFPREKDTRICTMVDAEYLATEIAKFNVEQFVNQCDCLPDCTSIVYHTEVSEIPYHYYDDAEVKNIKKYPGYLTHSKVRISFKEDHFISVNRDESSTMYDFLSNCGGLLGLFMGVSVLSIVEVVYYFTLRLGVNLWRQKSDRIKAAAVRIKRRCGAFMTQQWEKLKKLKQDIVAFIRTQLDKLGKCGRNCGAFIVNQWGKLRRRFKCKK